MWQWYDLLRPITHLLWRIGFWASGACSLLFHYVFFSLVSAYQGLRLLVLSCTILYHLNLCKTIFCCSRFLWTIPHLQDGLQRCFLNSVWICLLDLVNAHLKVTVCMGFRRVLEISPAATYIYGEECSIDDPCQSLVPADVIRIVQNAQWWSISTTITYHDPWFFPYALIWIHAQEVAAKAAHAGHPDSDEECERVSGKSEGRTGC